MFLDNSIYLGLAEEERVLLPLNMANRHGLIAGASGTGKTITMKVMAESFSDAGVPVFLCDAKGDVSGLCAPVNRMKAWKSGSINSASEIPLHIKAILLRSGIFIRRRDILCASRFPIWGRICWPVFWI